MTILQQSSVCRMTLSLSLSREQKINVFHLLALLSVNNDISRQSGAVTQTVAVGWQRKAHYTQKSVAWSPSWE